MPVDVDGAVLAVNAQQPAAVAWLEEDGAPGRDRARDGQFHDVTRLHRHGRAATRGHRLHTFAAIESGISWSQVERIFLRAVGIDATVVPDPSGGHSSRVRWNDSRPQADEDA
jgi:hypothetical protein